MWKNVKTDRLPRYGTLLVEVERNGESAIGLLEIVSYGGEMYAMGHTITGEPIHEGGWKVVKWIEVSDLCNG